MTTVLDQAAMAQINAAAKQQEDLREKTLNWLPTVDTTINHEEARKKHQAGTGD